MKLFIATLIALSGSSALAGTGEVGSGTLGSQAAAVTALASQEIVAVGQGNKVEGCAGFFTEPTLASCVDANSNLDMADFIKSQKGQKLTGKVRVVFFDQSGDCALSVAVDADNLTVIEVSNWICQ